MKIIFEAYCYDSHEADPYKVSYMVSCKSLKDAAHCAAWDLNDYYEHEYNDYGGAVVIIDGKVVYDAYPSGNYEFYGCKEFENLFNAKMRK